MHNGKERNAMNPILLAILLVGGIGLIAGAGLAIASVLMAVPRDEKAEQIESLLPGANCGACGYSGCAGYAAALAKGEGAWAAPRRTGSPRCNIPGSRRAQQPRSWT